MKKKIIIIIIPCRNEGKNITKTCESLGFSKNNRLSTLNAHLILIDNNSTDNTKEAILKVKNTSAPKNVTVGFEKEIGYIPPRKKGISLAINIARRNGYSLSNVIILQCDADIIYSPNYIPLMTRPFLKGMFNLLVEGSLIYQKDFESKYPGYINLCKSTDDKFFNNLGKFKEDVIVTDAISAFLLSDYLKWGGHQKELDKYGDEILSETTRLFIKARLLKAKKIRVFNAEAQHSPRKIVKNPDIDFVTAGFPRSNRWKRQWKKLYNGPTKIKDFSSIKLKKLNKLEELNTIRTKHLIAIFYYLPYLVLKLRGASKINLNHKRFNQADSIKLLSKKHYIKHPGELIDIVLQNYAHLDSIKQ